MFLIFEKQTLGRLNNELELQFVILRKSINLQFELFYGNILEYIKSKKTGYKKELTLYTYEVLVQFKSFTLN